MKAMVCEMCGSHDLIKQDGVYVCQNCGTKYTVEEAKKLLVEGTVKIDKSDEVSNYYSLARRAKDSKNYKDAEKYYDLIRQSRPDDWEASFYAPCYSAMQSNIAGISNSAYTISNSAKTALQLLKDKKDDVSDACNSICDFISNEAVPVLLIATIDHYNKFPTVENALGEKMERINAICSMQYNTGDCIERLFEVNNDIVKEYACRLWKGAVGTWAKAQVNPPVIEKTYVEKIKKYYPSYSAPYNPNRIVYEKTVAACYVATAVYGSYDCPEVWILRRYRDYTLAETWYGRVFIRTYYAISPTLVRWFGNTNWFKNIFKPRLDKMVSYLRKKGLSDKPYSDRIW